MKLLDRRSPAALAAALATTLLLGAGRPVAAEGSADALRLSAPRFPEPDTEPRPPDWMGENVEYRKGYGFEYRRALRMGQTPLDVGVLGPVVRKKKSVGLTLEVRF